MTLIMSYQKQSNLVMLGDLLVSNTDYPQKTPLSVPARFDDRFPVSNLDLSRLEQKIVILNDHLAAAWAGKFIIARSILNELQNKLIEPYSGEKILSIIDEMGLLDDEKKSVSFIFYAMKINENGLPNQVIVQDYLAGETIFDASDHKVKYAGSGTFHFFETISFDIKGETGSMNEFERCVATFLSRSALAFFNEVVSDDAHNFNYGGGFELLAPNPIEQRFEKLPFASAFWQVDGKDGLKLIGPILTNQYTENKELIISRIHYKKNEPILTRFVVPHMFGVADNDLRMPTPDFDPFWVIHYILGEEKDNIRLILKKGKEKNICFSMDENGMFSVKHTGEFVAEALDW